MPFADCTSMRLPWPDGRSAEDGRLAATLDARRPSLFRLARAIVGSAEAAEDVVQETCLRAWRSEARPEAEVLPAWLNTIAVRQALTTLEKAQRTRAASSIERVHHPELDLRLCVESTLDRLSPEHRTLLALCVGEGWSYAEVAEALEVPAGTVASRLHAAKEAFRRAWGGDE